MTGSELKESSGFSPNGLSDKYFREQYDVSDSKQSVNTSSLADEFLGGSSMKKSNFTNKYPT